MFKVALSNVFIFALLLFLHLKMLDGGLRLRGYRFKPKPHLAQLLDLLHSDDQKLSRELDQYGAFGKNISGAPF